MPGCVESWQQRGRDLLLILWILEAIKGTPGPLEFPLVSRIKDASQDVYGFGVVDVVLNVTFAHFSALPWMGLHSGARVDVGMGFGPKPPSPFSYGWKCRGRPFDHPTDGSMLAGSHLIMFDEGSKCRRGNVTWEVDLKRTGLFRVRTHGLVPPRYKHKCSLNGHEMRWAGQARDLQEGLAVRLLDHYLVLVQDGFLRISGNCGSLTNVVIEKLHPKVGDTDCWDFGNSGFHSFEYHMCCTTPSFHEVRAKCFIGPYTFERCCRSARRSSGVIAALPTSPAPRRHCIVPFHCQRECTGPGPEFYNAAPPWVTEAPMPEPLVCDGIPIYPLSLAVQEELVAECIPRKHFDFALVWPGDKSTYVLRDLPMAELMFEYFRMYRGALFAVTIRKSGHDASRHTEILASGTVPLFPDIYYVHNYSMTHHNKRLLKEALTLPGLGLGEIDPSAFNSTRYLELAQNLLLWTRHRLTTKAQASYALGVLGVPRENWENLTLLVLLPSRITTTGSDLLHGFREVLTPSNVVDYPFHEALYEPNPSRPAGAGFVEPGVAHLPVNYRLGWLDMERSRSALQQRLEGGGFDYVVYSWLQDNDLDEAVNAHVPKSRIVAVDGFDHTSKQMMQWARKVGTLFAYNMADVCTTSY